MSSKIKIAIIGNGEYVLGSKENYGVVVSSIISYFKRIHLKTKNLDIDIYYRSSRKKILISNINTKLRSNYRINLNHISKLTSFLNLVKYDLGFNCTPDYKHLYYNKLFISRNIPIWCVKPLTFSKQDLKYYLKMKNSNVYVDYHKRFDSSNLYIKKILDKNYKDLLEIEINYFQPIIYPLKIFKWSKKVNVFRYLGCHYIDILNYFFPNFKIIKLYKFPVKGILFNKMKIIDYYKIFIKARFNKNEFYINLNTGWSNPMGSPQKSEQNIKIKFNNEIYEFDQSHRGYKSINNTKIEIGNLYFFEIIRDLTMSCDLATGYGYESIKNFIDLYLFNKNLNNKEFPLLKNILNTEKMINKIDEK